MAFSCSRCSFTAQFESALLMHHQLHHEASPVEDYQELGAMPLKVKSKTGSSASPRSCTMNRRLNTPVRTSSATRLFSKLKARICKSSSLFAHPEETSDSTDNVNDHLSPSECTSKAMKMESVFSRTSGVDACSEARKETYGCHLCPFDADRITALDRHLLLHHKIGIESLLQLVMAKTKDGLSDDHNSHVYGIRQPYYRPRDDIIEEGEFIIETIAPKIKVLRHAATNTDEDIPSNDFSFEKNCQMISSEIESMLNGEKKYGNEEFLSKMRTLNECMCKFVDSSNALKKVLHNEFHSKTENEHLNGNEPIFCLELGDRDTPRNWERPHSEKLERSRNKYGESCRGDQAKQSAESFYF